MARRTNGISATAPPPAPTKPRRTQRCSTIRRLQELSVLPAGYQTRKKVQHDDVYRIEEVYETGEAFLKVGDVVVVR